MKSKLHNFFFTNPLNAKSKALYITIPASYVLCLILLLLIEQLYSTNNVLNPRLANNTRSYLEIIPVMLTTLVSGPITGVAVVLTFFIKQSIKLHQFAFHTLLLIWASLIINLPIYKNWFKSIFKTLMADLIFILLLGSIFGTLTIILSGHDIRKGMDLSCFIVAVLPCTFVCFLSYLFFSATPQKFRNLWFTGRLESEDYKMIQEQLSHRKGPKIGTKIITIVILEAVLLMASAFLFAIPLFQLQFPEIDSRNYIVYLTRMTFLMITVAIPIILFSISFLHITITKPVTLMSKAMEDFTSDATKQNQKFVLDIHLIPVHSNDEIGILHKILIKTVNTITIYIARLEKEKQLEIDLATAQSASKAKSAFLSNMSHEIRTPINAVLGLDEMIIRESSEQEIVNYAINIQSAGKSLLSLVNDILDFSKIEAGKLEIIPVEYELSSLINDLINMTSQKAKEKNLELHFSVDNTMPHLLFGDDIRIKQCILNILTNAVKYTNEGSVTITVTHQKADDSHILITVHVIDTGIGIHSEDIPKLFTAFQRIEEERNRTIEGTGLGMNIVQQLLSLMASKLEVKSEYGVGSDFYFTIKQRVINWEPIGNFMETYRKSLDSNAKYRESFHAPSAELLVVDDTLLNLKVIRDLLKQTLVHIDTATSGAETLKMITQKKYDVIFIDHRMPVMDGIETLQAMSTFPNNMNIGVPCIALTANAISGARQFYLNAGFTDYLTKPVDSKKLEKMLIHYLPSEKVELFNIEEQTENLSAENAELYSQALKQFAEAKEINLNEALTNCGSANLLKEALTEFHDSIEKKAEQIERYASEQDFKNFTVQVHALKSTARLIGATVLSQKAAHLEQCGDKNDAATIAEKTPELLALYRSYIEHLAAFSNAEPEETQKEMLSTEQYREALQNLKECVTGFDFDTAESILDLLDTYSIPQERRDEYKTIRALIKVADREGLLKLL
ncbi:MAG: response regulator [Treponema sp.]|nr:response regulator [Treponema sp.]